MSNEQHLEQDRCYFCLSDEEWHHAFRGRLAARIYLDKPEAFCPFMAESAPVPAQEKQ